MSDTSVKAVIKRVSSYLKSHEQALSTDDPNGNCAANHRGAISAAHYFLELLDAMEERR